MSTEKKDDTTVQQVEISDKELEELLGTPGAEEVMIPEEGENKNRNVFSSMNPDTSFLDKPDPNPKTDSDSDSDDSDDSDAGGNVNSNQDGDPNHDEDPIQQPGSDSDIDDGSDKKKGGRPQAIISVTKKLIDKGILLPFDDDKKLDEYTEEDFEELFEMNIQQMQEKLAEDLPAQFFSNMPVEMQQAYEYLANGGTDIKGMFQALAASTEVQQLDTSKESGQKAIIRSYLQATRWGTPEEIEDEIYSLEDKGELKKKAEQFKPKLDAMQQEIVNRKIAEQQKAQKLRQEQSRKYIESVYSTLEKGELNGIKLDNKIQNMLYAGLVQSNYPSISGKQTNMLGHLLEKYQWVEPRHDLIAEALWLLSDPDGYRKAIATNVERDTNKKVLRTLKTEQAARNNGGHQFGEQNNNGVRRRNVIPRPKKNFFSR